MASKSALHPPNETEHSVSRITQAGKKITYNLKVIQQPERARACGAGAKSSADRRPVDPPPVVELRIFESDPNNDFHKTDITFGYNANFFLFPTLEWARPMAHGRVQVQPPACPVLTGMAVAGIAYLDRPTQAGYFIFPDLSVRHEGMYRLNFNLYEEVKDPKDADKGARPPVQDNMVPSSPNKPRAPNRFLQFRLEVKSIPFQVYSAKKFPGLSESTTLSQIVAEQGCRVRIRRDVRMRRREHKPPKDFVYDNRHMTPKIYPGTPIERPRSTSNASIEDPYRYGASPHGPPAPEYAYHHPQYPNAHVPPPGIPGAPVPQSHLSFGATQTQYQAPPPPPPPQGPVPSSALPSPHTGYSHMRQTSASSEYDQQISKYPHFSPRPQVDMYEQQPKASLPPISIPTESPRTDSVRTPSYKSTDPRAYHSTPRMTPAVQTPRTPVHNLASSMPPPQPLAVDDPTTPVSVNGHHSTIRPKGWAGTTEPVATKRSHSSVFGDSQYDQPLHHGRRPDSLQNPNTNNGLRKRGAESCSVDGKATDDAMTYHRADGTLATRYNAANAVPEPAA